MFRMEARTLQNGRICFCIALWIEQENRTMKTEKAEARRTPALPEQVMVVAAEAFKRQASGTFLLSRGVRFVTRSAHLSRGVCFVTRSVFCHKERPFVTMKFLFFEEFVE